MTADFTHHLPDNILERYQPILTRFLQEHFSEYMPEVKMTGKIEMGEPAKNNIVEEAKKEEADFIVISTHGRTGLSHMLMGSVTEKVVRNAPCPVLSIHPQHEESRRQKVAAVA